MALSLTNLLGMREKGLRYYLLIVELFVVGIPLLILCYLFYSERFSITPTTLILVGFALFFILAGLVILRQIFDRLALSAASLKKAETGEGGFVEVRKGIAELDMITGSFTKLLSKLEETNRDLQQRVFELLTVKELTERASSILDAESLLGLLLEKTMVVSQAQRGSVFVVEFDANRFRVVASKGFDPRPRKDVYIKINDSVLQYLISERKPLLVKDIEHDPRTRKENNPKYGAPSFLSMPICLREDLIGVLNLARKESGQVFTSHDEHIASIMIGEIGFALDNARLHAESVEYMKQLEDRTVQMTKINQRLQQEISQRNQVEQELSDTNKFLTSILESSSSLSIVSTDLEQNILFWNKGAENLFGYKAGEMVGRHKIGILYPDEKVREEVEDIRSLITEKKSVRRELREITKDGRTIWVNLNLTPRFDERGNVMGILGIGEDITERKYAEEEQRKLEAQLQYVQKMEALGTLAGGIAHNFNNLLMGIQGYTSSMLQETDQTSPLYEQLVSIERLIDSGSLLTRQLLGYAREGRYEIRSLDVNRLVKETSETFGMTRKHITVHRSLADDLYHVRGDQGQIEQILWNLYANAGDAMPSGGELFLTTRNVSGTQMAEKPYPVKPGSYVLVSVEDTGTGMDKETMERIFEPFFTTKDRTEGTGLGLASVYGMIKAHSGYIDVRSQRGKGTSFDIYLPAAEGEAPEERPHHEKIGKEKETLLLVDDEPLILEATQKMLESLGYTVLPAKGGREAIETFQAHHEHIDMVILDMIMPDMNGDQVFEHLKTINPAINVIVTSGYGIDGKTSAMLKRGCDGFIQKPFDIKDLSEQVRNILDKP
jgi:PAS domain S-box-containing protein